MDGFTNGRANAGLGLLLVVLGSLFLVVNALDIQIWSFSWPFFVILPGLALFGGAIIGGRSTAMMAIPGSIVTTVGLILLALNTTGQWQIWAYVWSLIFPTAVGFGMLVAGVAGGRRDLARKGSGMVVSGAGLFAALFIFFELFIGLSGFGLGRFGDIALPALLIGAGTLLLLRQTLLPGQR